MNYQIQQFKNMRYLVNYPEGYREGEKYPILLFLHGAGSRGSDMNKIIHNPYFKITSELSEFPFISVVPQCEGNTWFDVYETLKCFVNQIREEAYTDKSRIYLMGVSMGGYAVWQLAMSMPECFAATIPICGGGMYWNADRLVNVPVWAFHGQKDTIVLSEESVKMVDAVNKSGGHAKITIYPEARHDAWSATYRNPQVYEWLLSNKNSNDVPVLDVYNDCNIYG